MSIDLAIAIAVVGAVVFLASRWILSRLKSKTPGIGQDKRGASHGHAPPQSNATTPPPAAAAPGPTPPPAARSPRIPSWPSTPAPPASVRPEKPPDTVVEHPLPPRQIPSEAEVELAENPWPAKVSVFYGTDRRPVSDSHLRTVDYGPERGSDLAFGTATVTIPRDHRRGCIERPNILRLEFREDELRHIVLKEVIPASEEAFLKQFTEELNRLERREAFLFVHGFNVTFAEACRRTAQIGYDLQSFVPVLFSWCSRGTAVDYLADSTAIQWCRPHLARFVAILLQRTNVRALHLIGHSMGTQALAALTHDLVGSDRVREIVLAAPDIDRQVFEQQIAPALTGGKARTTLYASSSDQALHLSKKANRGYSRLGDCEDGICVVPGVDTIDVTNVGTRVLHFNHSTVFDVRTMVEDLHRLMDNGMPVERRGLQPRDSPAGRYWVVPG